MQLEVTSMLEGRNRIKKAVTVGRKKSASTYGTTPGSTS